MDADTLFRCWLELKKQRDHWQDALELAREEVSNAMDIRDSDRDELLKIIREFETAQPNERDDLSNRMFKILVRYPAFESEFVDYATRRLMNKPDDRR